MPARSAGILLHRTGSDGEPEVLLVHPGGPYWAKKDLGAWSLPKGEHGDDEAPLAAALREFEEETGTRIDGEAAVDLGEVRQKGGKVVRAFAVAGDLDPDQLVSGTFELEWPPRSGRRRAFPEVDRAAWFGLAEARRRLLEAQVPFLDRLLG
jgi:predicted NUDIX family NTP pyrophosphohydrolase